MYKIQFKRATPRSKLAVPRDDGKATVHQVSEAMNVYTVSPIGRLRSRHAPVSHGNDLRSVKREVEKLKREVAALTAMVDPLAGARSRGVSYQKAELSSPANLTLAQAQAYAGRADRTINDDRRQGFLYALVPEGNTRGFRYPQWQFDVPAARLRPVLHILSAHGLSSWAMHSYFNRPNSLLDGRTPREVIGDVEFPLERLLGVVRARITEHQGAA